MSTLGDLLELLHTAARRQTRVLGTYRAWRDERLIRRLEEESEIWFGEDFENRRVARGKVEVSTSFWIDPPDRVRLERRDPDGNLTLLVAVDDGRRGVYTAGWGAEIEDHHPEDLEWVLGPLSRFLDPGPLLGSIELAPPAGAIVGGRRSLVARAEPRREPLPWPLGPADDYELFVEEAHGLLVKLVGYAGEEEALVHELIDLDFDAQFAEGAFVFDPPGAEEVSGLGLREAARLASFSAWALPIPATDIRYRAEFAPTKSPETLTLSYGEVMLLETPATSPYSVTSFEEPRRVDRAGRVYWALPGQLMFNVDDTFIVMTASSDIPTEELLDQAETLTKVD